MALISVDLFTLDHYDSYTWRKEALFQLALENSHPNPCSGCLSHKAFHKKMGVEKDCMISIWWVMNKNFEYWFFYPQTKEMSNLIWMTHFGLSYKSFIWSEGRTVNHCYMYINYWNEFKDLDIHNTRQLLTADIWQL